jgi:hypothetical protein
LSSSHKGEPLKRRPSPTLDLNDHVPDNPYAIGPDGRLWRFGFQGWKPESEYLRPTPKDLTRAAVDALRRDPAVREMRPLERCWYASELLRGAQR